MIPTVETAAMNSVETHLVIMHNEILNKCLNKLMDKTFLNRIFYFEKITDSCAVVRNDTEIFLVPFIQFLPNSDILQNWSTMSQLGYSH